jgi:hypothetical protein
MKAMEKIKISNGYSPAAWQRDGIRPPVQAMIGFIRRPAEHCAATA